MNYALTVLNNELRSKEEALLRAQRINKNNSTAVVSFAKKMVPNLEVQIAELKKSIRLINKKLK